MEFKNDQPFRFLCTSIPLFAFLSMARDQQQKIEIEPLAPTSSDVIVYSEYVKFLASEEFRDRETGYVGGDDKSYMLINHYSINNGKISSRVGIGAKYGNAYKDSEGNYQKGGNTDKITFPLNMTTKLFWSLALYDSETATRVDAEGQDYAF